MTWKLANYLRDFMFKQCVEVQVPFNDMILFFRVSSNVSGGAWTFLLQSSKDKS